MSNRKNFKQLFLKRNVILLLIPIFIVSLIILSLFFYFSYNKNIHYYNLLNTLIAKDFSFINIDNILKNNSNYLKNCTIIYINGITGSYTTIVKLGKYKLDLNPLILKGDSGYYRRSKYILFYKNLSFSNYVLLIIPYSTFFFSSQIMFFFTIISLLIIFIAYLIYNYYDYNKLKTIFINLYFTLKDIAEGNLNGKLRFSNIEEFDIIIEKINFLQKELYEKRIYYTENLEFLKKIVKTVTIPIIIFDNNEKLIEFNDYASILISDIFPSSKENDLKTITFNEFLISLAKKYKLENIKDIDKLSEKLPIFKIDSNTGFALIISNSISDSFKKFLINLDKIIEYYCTEKNINKKISYLECIKNLFDDINNIKILENKYQFYKNSINYISNMSHELRSPLNTIIGFSNIILQGIEGEISEQLKNDLTFIHNASMKLLMLIDEIIYISRFDKFKLYKKENNFSLDFFIDLIKSFFIGFSRINNVKFNTFIEENITFYYDFENLSFIFFNLFYYFFSIEKYSEIFLNIFRFNSSLYFILSTKNIENKNHYFDIEMNFNQEEFDKLLKTDSNIVQAKKIADFLEIDNFKWIKQNNDEFFVLEINIKKV